jgi:plasmid stability protein
MKMTLDLPENLIREMKLRAAREGRKLQDVATEVVQRGLFGPSSRKDAKANRVQFPLVECRQASPKDELSPSKVAEILTNQDKRLQNATILSPSMD